MLIYKLKLLIKFLLNPQDITYRRDIARVVKKNNLKNISIKDINKINKKLVKQYYIAKENEIELDTLSIYIYNKHNLFPYNKKDYILKNYNYYLTKHYNYEGKLKLILNFIY